MEVGNKHNKEKQKQVVLETKASRRIKRTLHRSRHGDDFTITYTMRRIATTDFE